MPSPGEVALDDRGVAVVDEHGAGGIAGASQGSGEQAEPISI